MNPTRTPTNSLGRGPFFRSVRCRRRGCHGVCRARDWVFVLHASKEIVPVPEFAPLAVLVAFILNALSCAIALDNAQIQPAYFEAGHRENPGPAELEGHGTADLSDVVLVARPVPVPAESGPSRTDVPQLSKRLATAPTRPSFAAMPVAHVCTSGAQLGDSFGWAPGSPPLDLMHHKRACQPHEESD